MELCGLARSVTCFYLAGETGGAFSLPLYLLLLLTFLVRDGG